MLPPGVRTNSPRRSGHPTWPRSHPTSLTGNAEAVEIDIGLFDEIVRIQRYSTARSGRGVTDGLKRTAKPRAGGGGTKEDTMTGSHSGATRVRNSRWVVPLCWSAVLLDGFDLVVLGTVIPVLTKNSVFGITDVSATSDRHHRPDRHDDRRDDHRHRDRLSGPAQGDDLRGDRVFDLHRRVASPSAFTFGRSGSWPGWAWAAACRPPSPWPPNSPPR